MSPTCPVCSRTFPTPQGLSHHFRHRREAGDAPHITYETAREDARWTPLTEGRDYVRCLECGHRTVTLARHLKGEHGITADQYRAKHGEGVPIRCDALKAKRGAAISARPIAKGEQKSVVCPTCGGTWEGSKYLGTIHDLRCDPCRERDWEGKSEPADFVMCRVCGYRAENLTSHVQNDHPDLIGTYRDTYPGAEIVSLRSPIRDKAAIRGVPRTLGFRRKMSKSLKALNRILRLTPALLLGFRLKNGKVSLGAAMSGLGRSYSVVKRECLRNGLAYHNCLVSQDRFLGLLAKVIGAEPHREWSSDQLVNPRTERRFRFDGYFDGMGLLVELHGYQHYTFPNRYHRTEDDYLDARWRDDEKRRQVTASGAYRYLEVREDEPWQDKAYLRERLVDLGVPV